MSYKNFSRNVFLLKNWQNIFTISFAFSRTIASIESSQRSMSRYQPLKSTIRSTVSKPRWCSNFNVRCGSIEEQSSQGHTSTGTWQAPTNQIRSICSKILPKGNFIVSQFSFLLLFLHVFLLFDYFSRRYPLLYVRCFCRSDNKSFWSMVKLWASFPGPFDSKCRSNFVIEFIQRDTGSPAGAAVDASERSFPTQRVDID